MINEVKETLCSKCAKSDVCKYSELFLVAQREADFLEVNVAVMELPTEHPSKMLLSGLFDGKHGISIEVKCANFLRKESGGLGGLSR